MRVLPCQKYCADLSEFSGLRKHKKTQQALVGLGSAALAAAVAVPRYGRPNVPKGIMNRVNYNNLCEIFMLESRMKRSGFQSDLWQKLLKVSLYQVGSTAVSLSDSFLD